MKKQEIFKNAIILLACSFICLSACKKTTNEPDTPINTNPEVQVFAGGGHSYLLKADGTLWGVGWNDFGQIGTGDLINLNNWGKITDNVKSVAAGYQYSLILKKDNTVWATGVNTNGQLGNGNKTNQLKLVQVATNAAKIFASKATSFILKTDGTFWGAGWNYFGMLGNNGIVESLNFIQIDQNIKDVAIGANHTLFLKTDHSVWGAGANNGGQLGREDIKDYTVEKIKILDNVKAIAAGTMHSLFLKNDNTLWVTGYNSSGELANAIAIGSNLFKPAQIATDVKEIQCGPVSLNTYILKTDNTLWGAGNNTYGQLANKTNAHLNSFTKISDNVATFSAGYAHLLLTKTDRSVWACGADDIGQIGDGSLGEHKNTLVKVKIP